MPAPNLFLIYVSDTAAARALLQRSFRDGGHLHQPPDGNLIRVSRSNEPTDPYHAIG
jgi:hypothetical protein